MDFKWRKAWLQIIEVDHLPLTTFSRLPPLLVNAIGNIRQSFHHLTRTTPGPEEFLSSRPGSVSMPHLVSYTEPLTMALGVIISFLGLLRSLEVLSHYLLRLFHLLLVLNNIIGVCLCPWEGIVSNLRRVSNGRMASLSNIKR